MIIFYYFVQLFIIFLFNLNIYLTNITSKIFNYLHFFFRIFALTVFDF